MSLRGTISVGEIRLSFDQRGRPNRPPMVLLHALGDAAGDWDSVAGRFAASFHLLAVELRGHGESDWPGQYSFAAMESDVITVLERWSARPVVLVGHSMGGVVAYRVAMHRPDLVDRLIVEDVTPPYRRDAPIPERPDDADTLGFDWEVVPAIVGEVNAGSPEMWTGLASISAPTLLIGGGSDSHIPQDKLADVAARIPQCELVTIAAGHYVHAAEPNRFANAVLDWLGR